jgi:hypothetical protein
MSWFLMELARHHLDVPSVFVETGAYMGDGIACYLECMPFQTIHSIELAPQWVVHCRERFAKQLGTRVHIHEGDSSLILPNLPLPKTKPVLFYLDAHFSGGATAGADIDNGCPVLRELAWIVSRNVAGDVVFIDDMRLMGKDSFSGIEGHAIYPRTRFDFTHVTEDAIRKIIGNRGIRLWTMCVGFDRLLIVLD